MITHDEKRNRESGWTRVAEYLWKRKVWWLLPLCVFFLLLGIIYALGHFSRTDSEMYPTTNARMKLLACIS